MVKKQLRKATSTLAEVLMAVEGDVTMSAFAKANGYTKGYVSRLFRRVAKQGFICREYRSSFVVWSLTRDGRELLAGFRTGMKEATCKYVFRWEHLLLVSDWEVLPRRLEEVLTKEAFVYSPRHNWGGWEKSFEDVTLFVTRKSVWFLVRPVVAESVEAALARGLEVTQRARLSLEVVLGGKLAKPVRKARLRRQEVALVGGMTRVWPRWFGTTDRVKIDASKGAPEVETTHKALAVEDMERILAFQDAVARGVLNAEQVRQLVEVLPIIAEFAESLRRPSQPGERRDVW